MSSNNSIAWAGSKTCCPRIWNLFCILKRRKIQHVRFFFNPGEVMNILFVDDEQPILDMVREYFSSKDYRVFLAHNGKEGHGNHKKEEKIEC